MTNSDKKEQKEPKILICNLCDFNTCKKIIIIDTY